MLCDAKQTVLIDLSVDLVKPNLLLRSGRVVAHTQERAHLLDTNEEDLSGHVESDTLGAGRGCEASSTARGCQCRIS